MTTKAAHHDEQARREHVNEMRRASLAQERRRRRIVLAAWVAGLAVLISVVTAMMLTSRPDTSSAARTAPDFTLTSTAGQQVRLADYRGRNVLLYFSEGVGCQSCLVQMAQIEKSPEFAKAGVTVLPIVMNTRDAIMRDMATNGVKTPFLLDDGKVSTAYGTIGKGMHAGLPGHSFVLIDKAGVQRWYGEYPSMYLSSTELMSQVRQRLPS